MWIVSIEPAFETLFWQHINKDIPHYYFFAFDWKYNRNETKILLAENLPAIRVYKKLGSNVTKHTFS
ncbi:MAG: hypothetical protein ACUVUF_03230 [Candidatus Bathycorpusculaceae bacterium]